MAADDPAQRTVPLARLFLTPDLTFIMRALAPLADLFKWMPSLTITLPENVKLMAIAVPSSTWFATLGDSYDMFAAGSKPARSSHDVYFASKLPPADIDLDQLPIDKLVKDEAPPMDTALMQKMHARKLAALNLTQQDQKSTPQTRPVPDEKEDEEEAPWKLDLACNSDSEKESEGKSDTERGDDELGTKHLDDEDGELSHDSPKRTPARVKPPRKSIFGREDEDNNEEDNTDKVEDLDMGVAPWMEKRGAFEVGLYRGKNQTCYQNVVYQLLYNILPLRNLLLHLRIEDTDSDAGQFSSVYFLRRMFSTRQTAKKSFINAFTDNKCAERTLRNISTDDIHYYDKSAQQDAFPFLARLIERLEHDVTRLCAQRELETNTLEVGGKVFPTISALFKNTRHDTRYCPSPSDKSVTVQSTAELERPVMVDANRTGLVKLSEALDVPGRTETRRCELCIQGLENMSEVEQRAQGDGSIHRITSHKQWQDLPGYFLFNVDKTAGYYFSLDDTLSMEDQHATHTYVLSSVIVHHGTRHSGHYTILMRDSEKLTDDVEANKDVPWREFNDEAVRAPISPLSTFGINIDEAVQQARRPARCHSSCYTAVYVLVHREPHQHAAASVQTPSDVPLIVENVQSQHSTGGGGANPKLEFAALRPNGYTPSLRIDEVDYSILKGKNILLRVFHRGKDKKLVLWKKFEFRNSVDRENPARVMSVALADNRWFLLVPEDQFHSIYTALLQGFATALRVSVVEHLMDTAEEVTHHTDSDTVLEVRDALRARLLQIAVTTHKVHQPDGLQRITYAAAYFRITRFFQYASSAYPLPNNEHITPPARKGMDWKTWKELTAFPEYDHPVAEHVEKWLLRWLAAGATVEGILLKNNGKSVEETLRRRGFELATDETAVLRLTKAKYYLYRFFPTPEGNQSRKNNIVALLRVKIDCGCVGLGHTCDCFLLLSPCQTQERDKMFSKGRCALCLTSLSWDPLHIYRCSGRRVPWDETTTAYADVLASLQEEFKHVTCKAQQFAFVLSDDPSTFRMFGQNASDIGGTSHPLYIDYVALHKKPSERQLPLIDQLATNSNLTAKNIKTVVLTMVPDEHELSVKRIDNRIRPQQNARRRAGRSEEMARNLAAITDGSEDSEGSEGRSLSTVKSKSSGSQTTTGKEAPAKKMVRVVYGQAPYKVKNCDFVDFQVECQRLAKEMYCILLHMTKDTLIAVFIHPSNVPHFHKHLVWAADGTGGLVGQQYVTVALAATTDSGAGFPGALILTLSEGKKFMYPAMQAFLGMFLCGDHCKHPTKTIALPDGAGFLTQRECSTAKAAPPAPNLRRVMMMDMSFGLRAAAEAAGFLVVQCWYHIVVAFRNWNQKAEFYSIATICLTLLMAVFTQDSFETAKQAWDIVCTVLDLLPEVVLTKEARQKWIQHVEKFYLCGKLWASTTRARRFLVDVVHRLCSFLDTNNALESFFRHLKHGAMDGIMHRSLPKIVDFFTERVLQDGFEKVKAGAGKTDPTRISSKAAIKLAQRAQVLVAQEGSVIPKPDAPTLVLVAVFRGAGGETLCECVDDVDNHDGDGKDGGGDDNANGRNDVDKDNADCPCMKPVARGKAGAANKDGQGSVVPFQAADATSPRAWADAFMRHVDVPNIYTPPEPPAGVDWLVYLDLVFKGFVDAALVHPSLGGRRLAVVRRAIVSYVLLRLRQHPYFYTVDVHRKHCTCAHFLAHEEPCLHIIAGCIEYWKRTGGVDYRATVMGSSPEVLERLIIEVNVIRGELLVVINDFPATVFPSKAGKPRARAAPDNDEGANAADIEGDLAALWPLEGSVVERDALTIKILRMVPEDDALLQSPEPNVGGRPATVVPVEERLKKKKKTKPSGHRCVFCFDYPRSVADTRGGDRPPASFRGRSIVRVTRSKNVATMDKNAIKEAERTLELALVLRAGKPPSQLVETVTPSAVGAQFSVSATHTARVTFLSSKGQNPATAVQERLGGRAPVATAAATSTYVALPLSRGTEEDLKREAADFLAPLCEQAQYVADRLLRPGLTLGHPELADRYAAAGTMLVSPNLTAWEIACLDLPVDGEPLTGRGSREGSWCNAELVIQFLAILTKYHTSRLNLEGERLLPRCHVVNPYLTQMIQTGKLFWQSAVFKKGLPTLMDGLKNFDLVIMPINLSNQHWVLVVVDLLELEFVLYDSLGPSEASLESIVAPIRAFMCKYCRLGAQRDWRMKLKEGMPQQVNGRCCGVFMLRAVQCVMGRLPLAFTQADMRRLRDRMCVQVVCQDMAAGPVRRPLCKETSMYLMATAYLSSDMVESHSAPPAAAGAGRKRKGGNGEGPNLRKAAKTESSVSPSAAAAAKNANGGATRRERRKLKKQADSLAFLRELTAEVAQTQKKTLTLKRLAASESSELTPEEEVVELEKEQPKERFHSMRLKVKGPMDKDQCVAFIAKIKPEIDAVDKGETPNLRWSVFHTGGAGRKSLDYEIMKNSNIYGDLIESERDCIQDELERLYPTRRNYHYVEKVLCFFVFYKIMDDFYHEAGATQEDYLFRDYVDLDAELDAEFGRLGSKHAATSSVSATTAVDTTNGMTPRTHPAKAGKERGGTGASSLSKTVVRPQQTSSKASASKSRKKAARLASPRPTAAAPKPPRAPRAAADKAAGSSDVRGAGRRRRDSPSRSDSGAQADGASEPPAKRRRT